MELLGEESLELFVDFTWFIAGGFGAALFFILNLGGVEDLDEDPDWPWFSWALLGLVGLGGCGGGCCCCGWTITLVKKAAGCGSVFS